MGKSQIRRDPEILDDLDCGQFQRFLSCSLLASCLVIQRQSHKESCATRQQHHQPIDRRLFDRLILCRVLQQQIHKQNAEADHCEEQIL